MNTENRDETFKLTYSAKQQEEIRNIRKKYLPREDKMEQLRRLDRGVIQKGTSVSLILGIIGALVLGLGMCCVMVWQDTMFAVGIIIGIAGIALVCCAYPAYNLIIKKERDRIAPEIIRLTDELMK